MCGKRLLFALCVACLVIKSAQLPSGQCCSLINPGSSFFSEGMQSHRNLFSGALRKPAGGPLRIRGGADSETVEEEEPGKVSLLDELKNNLSWNPADHPSAFHWALCVILNLYVSFGAPFASYIPILKDLALSRKPKKEKKLTKADLDRLEREAIRKEQDEEYEKSLLEDKVKSQAEKKKQELQEAAEKAAREEAEAMSSVIDAYKARVEEAKQQLGAEPEGGSGVVMLRLRCPDGLQLTRRFDTASNVAEIYHFLDVERCNKAENTAKPEEALLALANEEYSLVSTRPKLNLDDKTVTIASAGVTTSCALMVKPVVKDD